MLQTTPEICEIIKFPKYLLIICLNKLIMSEMLEVYDLEGNFLKVQDRGQFYKEIKSEFAKKGKISRQLKRIGILLMNSKGKIVIQRRNWHKNENPGLYDKTIGGHVVQGDSFNLTVIKECAEELGFPVSILSAESFDQAIKNVDLRIVGFFKKVDYMSNFISIRRTKQGKEFRQPYMQNVYIGYYNGPIQFIDGESRGIELFTYEELQSEIVKHPNDYTEDLKFMVKKYKKFLVPIMNT